MWSNVINPEKISPTVLCKCSHIQISTPLSINHACNWCNKRYQRFSLLLNQYISNISNLYNLDVDLSFASQMICDHMFSDPKLYYIYSYFLLRTWFIYFSPRMWQLSTYSEDGYVLEYIVSWLTIESNWPEQEYYFLPITKHEYRTKF